VCKSAISEGKRDTHEQQRLKLTSSINVFSSQLRSSTESNKRSVETLEAKLTKMKAEWESSKLAHEATRAEFESYKVRLAQRLKKQKEFSVLVCVQQT